MSRALPNILAHTAKYSLHAYFDLSIMVFEPYERQFMKWFNAILWSMIEPGLIIYRAHSVVELRYTNPISKKRFVRKFARPFTWRQQRKAIYLLFDQMPNVCGGTRFFARLWLCYRTEDFGSALNFLASRIGQPGPSTERLEALLATCPTIPDSTVVTALDEHERDDDCVMLN